jgi:hypothetical protein
MSYPPQSWQLRTMSDVKQWPHNPKFNQSHYLKHCDYIVRIFDEKHIRP